jgi:hypothetical protein
LAQLSQFIIIMPHGSDSESELTSGSTTPASSNSDDWDSSKYATGLFYDSTGQLYMTELFLNDHTGEWIVDDVEPVNVKIKMVLLNGSTHTFEPHVDDYMNPMHELVSELVSGSIERLGQTQLDLIIRHSSAELCWTIRSITGMCIEYLFLRGMRGVETTVQNDSSY